MRSNAHSYRNNHALKEVDAASLAVAETPEQVVAALGYAITGELAPPARAAAE